MNMLQVLLWMLLAFDFQLNLAAYPCKPVSKKITIESELLCGKRRTKEECIIGGKCNWNTCCKGVNSECKDILNPQPCAASKLQGGCIWDCDGDLVDNLVDPKDAKTKNKLYKSVKYVGQSAGGEADVKKPAKHKKRKKNVHKVPDHNAWEYINGISMIHVDAVGIIYRAQLNADAYFKPEEIEKYKKEIQARKKKPKPIGKLQIDTATASKIEGVLEKNKLLMHLVTALQRMQTKEIGTEKRSEATSILSMAEKIKMKTMSHPHKLVRQDAKRGNKLLGGKARRRLGWEQNDWKDATTIKQYVPFSSIGMLEWTCDPTDSRYEGTGAVVYKKDGYIYILTAGHNCWDDDEAAGNKASTAIKFALNYHDPKDKTDPFSQNKETHSVDYEIYMPEYKLHAGTVPDLEEYTYDWCVVKIKANGKLDEPALRMYYDNRLNVDVDLFLGAYSIIPVPPPPADKTLTEYYLVYLDNEAKSKFEAKNSYYKSKSEQFTTEGLSGTPWVDGYDKRTIIGIHVGEENIHGTNCDIINRITKGKFRAITKWIGMNKKHNIWEATQGSIEYGWTNPGELIGYSAKEAYHNVYHNVYDDSRRQVVSRVSNGELIDYDSQVSNGAYYGNRQYLQYAYVAIGGLGFMLFIIFFIGCFFAGFIFAIGLTWISERLKKQKNQISMEAIY